MACGGCNQKVLNSDEKTILFSSGKIERHPMQSLDGVIKKGDTFGKPSVLDDGAILYPESEAIPPDINGYIRDPDYPYLFHCDWVGCDQRILGCRNTKKGAIDVIVVCAHKDSRHYGKRMKPEVCRACPLRQMDQGETQ